MSCAYGRGQCSGMRGRTPCDTICKQTHRDQRRLTGPCAGTTHLSKQPGLGLPVMEWGHARVHFPVAQPSQREKKKKTFLFMCLPNSPQADAKAVDIHAEIIECGQIADLRRSIQQRPDVMRHVRAAAWSRKVREAERKPATTPSDTDLLAEDIRLRRRAGGGSNACSREKAW
jgi:hypothetical protein